MKVIHEEQSFKVVNWGNEQIDFTTYDIKEELRPGELHIKENGAMNDTRSFCFVLKNQNGENFVAQISEEMLNRGLNASRRTCE